jgi:hypothetical protein
MLAIYCFKDTTVNNTIVQQTQEALQQKLDRLINGLAEVAVAKNDKALEVRIYGEGYERLLEIERKTLPITYQTSFSIMEAYDPDSLRVVLMNIQQASEKLSGQPLAGSNINRFTPLNQLLDTKGVTFEIGRARATQLINDILQSKEIKPLIPDGLFFYWGTFPDADGRYGLYAVKQPPADCRIDITMLKKTNRRHSKFASGDEFNITLLPEYNDRLFRLTARDTSKLIMIAVNETILFAAKNSAPIENGDMVINYLSDSDAEKLDRISDILKERPLPAALVLCGINTFNDK